MSNTATSRVPVRTPVVDRQIKLMQWNANGLNAHLNELRQYLASISGDQPSVICVQETFLKPGKNINLPGYAVFRNDRLNNPKGGIATFVKSNLNAMQIKTPDNVESLGIKIVVDKSALLIYNIYNPPGVNIDVDKYKPFFANKNAFITGDLNAKNTLWRSPKTNKSGEILEQLLVENDFIVLNTGQPTYQCRLGGQSHLDLSITSSSMAIKCNWFTINNTLGSDHQPTFTILNETPDELEPCTKWLLSKADWQQYTANCKDIFRNWSHNINDPDEGLKHIVDSINCAALSSIPQSKPRKRNKAVKKQLPYWNEQCRHAVYERNRARNKMNKTRDLNDCMEYRRLKGVAQNVIKMQAKLYWQNYCGTIRNNEKLGAVWNMAKRMNGSTVNIRRHILKDNGITAESDIDKANLMASYFAKISSNSNYSDNFKVDQAQKEQQFSEEIDGQPQLDDNAVLNENFNLAEIFRAIKDLKNDSSPGDDKISYEMLKHLPRKAVKILLKFYNKCWESGKLPGDFKHALILPIHKAEKDPSNPSSYRPISLTSTIGKLMERLVTNRLNWFLEKNCLLNNNQSGFRHGRSTQDNIIRLQDQINKFLRNEGYTVGLFLDFEKAYDMLWRPGLLVKLKRLGITGSTLNYVKAFLNDRTFQVKIGNVLSAKSYLETGIAQGSIIAPLLFLIMINDFPESLNIENMLFADDSATFKSGKNLKFIVDQMQKHLDKIAHWCDEWGFKLSESKTVAVVFSLKHIPADIMKNLKIGNKPVRVENTVKFLGVVFDNRLTWRSHIEYLNNKCKRRLQLMQVICGNKWGADITSLLTVYKTLVRPIIDYGAIAYDSASKTMQDVVERIQNRALRICTGCMKSTEVALLQNECGIMPLRFRRLEQQIKFAITIKSTINHPASNAVSDNWTLHYGKSALNRELFYNKTKHFFSQNKAVIECIKLSSMPPWHFKPVIVDLVVSDIISKQDPPEVIKQTAIEHYEKYAKYCSIYTDGSKSEKGLVGSAFYVKYTNERYSYRIANDLTIYTAELVAIKQALIWVQRMESIFKLGTKVAIFSDSKSALESIKSERSKLRPNLLLNILEILSKLDTSISFVWIPAHVNLSGNEIADQLAKAALLHTKIDLDIKFEARELYSMVDDYVLEAWQLDWTKNQSTNNYRTWYNTVSKVLKHNENTRPHQTLITRLRLGACGLNHHLCKIGCHDNGFCTNCNVPETVQHFLIDCPYSAVATALKTKSAELNILCHLQNCLTVPALTRIIYLNNTRSKI
jgi:ribonuclease HI